MEESTMRTLLLSVGLGAICLGLLGVAPSEAEARWRQRRGYYYYPPAGYYYPARTFYYGPAYYYPSTAYYAPPAYPSYSYQSSYGPDYSAASPATTISITAYDNYFEPGTIRVQPGTTVQFMNYGRHVHTVTSSEGTWDSGDIPPGGSYVATFQYPGTYYYYCRHHEGMRGTIVVGFGGGYGGSGSSGY
jgi:plastocyanin